MSEFSTGDVVIGVIASLGVVVLVAVFVYVVKQLLARKD
jgi:hypothetical protein